MISGKARFAGHQYGAHLYWPRLPFLTAVGRIADGSGATESIPGKIRRAQVDRGRGEGVDRPVPLAEFLETKGFVDLKVTRLHYETLSQVAEDGPVPLLVRAGQRHGGALLTLARELWPRWFIRQFLSCAGLFMMIEARR